MTPQEMTAALAVYSARAEPIIPEGWKVPNGYTLHGPRGRKGCVGVDARGHVPDFDIKLFCDSIAYVDAKIAERGRY